MRLRPGSTTLILASAIATTASFVLADELWFADGNRQEVAGVLNATWKEVSWKGPGGAPQSRPADELVRVVKSGDSSLDRGVKYLAESNPSKAEELLKKALESREAWAKPFAQFFLGELYQDAGKTKEAIDAYLKVEALDAQHFYAPWGLLRAAELARADGAKHYDKLASGAFGDAWKDKGAFGKARMLLTGGKAKEAQALFAQLAGKAKTPELKQLAACAEAHASIAAGGGKNDAKGKFESVLRDAKASPAAQGYAWRGLGECLPEAQAEEAMLCYLRSLLLFPENPEAGGAARLAAELSKAKGWKAEGRLSGLAANPIRLPAYTAKDRDAEVMRRCLQLVSANLVRSLAPKLAEKARDADEKAELEYLAADALKAVGSSSKDQKLLQEYEKVIAELQKKYPKHARAGSAGMDAFQAARDQAIALVGQAADEPDEAKSKALLDQARQKFTSTLTPFLQAIEGMNKEVDKALEAEAEEEDEAKRKALEEQRLEAEAKRDFAAFLLAESYLAYAQSFPEGDKVRTENLEKALKAYDTFSESCSAFRLLWYGFIGRGEALLGLAKYPEAIMQFEELVNVEPPFDISKLDPDGKKYMTDLIKDVGIRGYYGLCRALNGGGRSADAFDRVKNLDEDKRLAGWRDHPMGILLTFELAKSMAGGGQGAEGAEQIFAIVRKAKNAPEGEKIPGLGMSRIGAGACRALSELSDQTGGEIYSPEIQYATGTGYFLRRRPELAISAFKGVITAARTRDEREEWVPRAVSEIGSLLFQQERYLEAAIAYETVFTEFPEHEKAQEAAKIALSASKRACEQFKEDPTTGQSPIAKLYKRITDGAKALGAGFENLEMNEAADLQRKGDYARAAAGYLKVDKTAKFYANAVANAGYCYFQAYKANKDEKLLKDARENLQLASKLGKERQDLDSQALACYYLGQLEAQLDRHKEALAALAPYDAELAEATKYLVRAKRTQADSYLALGKLEEAEACFEKVKDQRSRDEDRRELSVFGYGMAKGVRAIAMERFKKNKDVEESRTLRAKAAKYMKAWFETSSKETLRADHYWYAGSFVFAGGEWEAAAALYAEALQKFQRPALDGKKPAAEANESFDLAEEALGFSLAMSGKHEEAFQVLSRLRDSVYVTDLEGNKLGRGTFKGRDLGGPFTVKVEGRTLQQKKYFTLVEIDGKQVKFFDTADRGGGGSEFQGIEGTDAGPPANYARQDERKLVLEMKGSFYLVSGMAKAAWGLWEAKKDQNFLANDVTAATNLALIVLRSMGDSSYAAIAASTLIEPTDHALACWQAEVQILRVKLAREKWGEVLSDLGMMEKLGRSKQAPEAIKAELAEIQKEAEAKK